MSGAKGSPQVIALVGATGVGKSAVALELATSLGGEVVNADAFALYRGMDIGTAKTPSQERRGIPHHLIDLLDISEPLSVAWYQQRGREVLGDLAARGRSAIVVGGSWLYVRALLDDLRFPGSDPQIRARWERRLEEVGAPALHADLARRDPVAAAAILPSNGRRIVRALEVGELTGGPFQATLPKAGPPLIPHVSIGLDGAQDWLERRIEWRVDQMLADGWLAEVALLSARGLANSPTAGKALGYPQLLAHLSGSLTLAQARAEVVLLTRRFARKQRKWFRADPRTQWISVNAASSYLCTAEAVLAKFAGYRT